MLHTCMIALTHVHTHAHQLYIRHTFMLINRKTEITNSDRSYTHDGLQTRHINMGRMHGLQAQAPHTGYRCGLPASLRAWKREWEASGPTRVHPHVSDPGEGFKGEDLSRKHWTTLNRLRTGVGRYKASLKKWGLADSAACECGEPEQTADHIINSCPLHRPPS